MSEIMSQELLPEREQKASQILHQIELEGGVETEEKNLKVYEVKDPEGLFNWAVKNGFLLHGSPNLHNIIEPRKAHDTKRPLGSLNAIYMSKYPATSMAKVIVGNNRGGYSFSRDQQGNITKYDIYTADLNTLNENGYMYIVDFDDHDEIADGDYVSYRPIAPYAVVKFSKNDFKYPIRERK